MKDRIQQLIDYKGISPGDLAERLDVQRSNISHILNGRNKPGALFIEKLLQAFPDIDARWLLTGVGTMISNQEGNNVTPIEKQPEKSSMQQQLFSTVDVPAKKVPSYTGDKIIEKVILIYSDGTFTYHTTK